MGDVVEMPPQPGLLLGYYEGWADAKAGRQYGEGRHGRRSFTVDTDPPICGVVSNSGPNGEPLACAFPPHEPTTKHSWATLPTYVSRDHLSRDADPPTKPSVGPDGLTT